MLYKIRYQNGNYGGTKNIVSSTKEEAIDNVRKWVRSQYGVFDNEQYDIVDSIKIEPDTLDNRMDKIFNF